MCVFVNQLKSWFENWLLTRTIIGIGKRVEKIRSKGASLFQPQSRECIVCEMTSVNARHIVPVVHTRTYLTRAVVIRQ